jgi:hypothetical protein
MNMCVTAEPTAPLALLPMHVPADVTLLLLLLLRLPLRKRQQLANGPQTQQRLCTTMRYAVLPAGHKQLRPHQLRLPHHGLLLLRSSFADADQAHNCLLAGVCSPRPPTGSH